MGRVYVDTSVLGCNKTSYPLKKNQHCTLPSCMALVLLRVLSGPMFLLWGYGSQPPGLCFVGREERRL